MKLDIIGAVPTKNGRNESDQGRKTNWEFSLSDGSAN